MIGLEGVAREVRKLRAEMAAVKRELGREEDELVFVGMADVAQFWWCAEKSVLNNREMELSFFCSLKDDVWDYSLWLGYRKEEETPSPSRLLELRERISFGDIERLLREERPPEREGSLADLHIRILHSWLKGEIPSASIGAVRKAERLMERGAPPQEVLPLLGGVPPRLRGEILHYYAEQYPTIRWNFDWREYIVVGVPDGIADRFVYEFKTSESLGFFRKWVWPVATAQGDLYGRFFRREEKRIQALLEREGRIETWQLRIDRKEALDTLERFRRVEKGEKDPAPPAEWKCRRCEFRWRCALRRGIGWRGPPS